MLKCIKYYENINLKLATGEQPLETCLAFGYVNLCSKIIENMLTLPEAIQ